MADWLRKVQILRESRSRLVAGIMSGTSVDSIDIALCEIRGAGTPVTGRTPAVVKLKGFYRHKFPRKLQERIRSINKTNVEEVSQIHAEAGEAFAEAVLWAMHHSGVKPDLIGSHGQTVYHHSGRSGQKSTLQLGDGDRIAVHTGVVTVSDFRAKDLAVNGEGAPLSPYADLILFPTDKKSKKTRRVVLNLGGIANLTVLDADPERVFGFDTGPANAPIDRLARLCSKGKYDYDPDGKLARKGKIDEALVKKLLREDVFLRRVPPKSTGTESYGEPFVKKLLKVKKQTDALACATEFVARSIAFSLETFVARGEKLEIILAGGGTQNKFLIERLREAVAPSHVSLSDDYGVPWYAREAMAFAILANDALFGLPTSLPGVSGCSRGVTLGKLSFPE